MPHSAQPARGWSAGRHQLECHAPARSRARHFLHPLLRAVAGERGGPSGRRAGMAFAASALALTALAALAVPPTPGPKPGLAHRTCSECVSAGLGWSLKKNKCSLGFRNRDCPVCWLSPATNTVELEVFSPPGLGMSTFSLVGRPIVSLFVGNPAGTPKRYLAIGCELLKTGSALLAVNGRGVGAPLLPNDLPEEMTAAEAVRDMNSGTKWPLRLSFTARAVEPDLPSDPRLRTPLPGANLNSHRMVEMSRHIMYDRWTGTEKQPSPGPDEPQSLKITRERERAEHITALMPEQSLSVADEATDEWETRRRQLLGQLTGPEQPPSRQQAQHPTAVKRSRHFAAERPSESTRPAAVSAKKAQRQAEMARKVAQKRQHEEYHTAMTTLKTVLHECDPIFLGPTIGWTAEVFRKSLSPHVKGVNCEVDMSAVSAICGEERDACLEILSDQADHPEPGFGWNPPGVTLLAALDEAAAAADRWDEALTEDDRESGSWADDESGGYM